MAASRINLDGTETSIIKALGLMGSEIDGDTLFERCKGMAEIEFLDALKGLIDVGYVDADSSVFYSIDEAAKLSFRVNPGYLKEIRDALDPEDEPRSKRVRRE